MKQIILASLLLIAAVACRSVKDTTSTTPKYDCIAYVWSDEGPLPPADKVTAINYAFAYPNDTRDGIKISNPQRLRQVVALKEQNPSLKVLLSMGGNCHSGYSELVADPTLRKSYARDCLRAIEQYNLDGIDMDWEFPGSEGGTVADIDNFPLLLKDIREAIGPDRLLTVAGGSGAMGFKFPDILDYVDYINVMAYDMGWQAPRLHTPLRRSGLAGIYSVEESLAAFTFQGVPNDKLVLGLAFYGRGDNINFKGWTDYKNIHLVPGMQERWDSVACVPYIVDDHNRLIISYDDPRSLKIKCDYIKQRGLRGAMYWRTECDDSARTLTNTVARELLGK